MKFGLLGVLEVIDGDGGRVDVGRPQQGALLALLLLHANRVVSVRTIVEGLWGEDPPESSVNLVQGGVSRLRKVLGGDARLETVAPGYRLGVPLDAVDLGRFERLATEGRNALVRGEPTAAVDALGRALRISRGPALAEFAELPFAKGEATRLARLVSGAEEDWVDARLALDQHTEVTSVLERLVDQDPFSERRWGQLMTALYRAGRQADALEAFQRARRLLVDHLGLEPGPGLRRIEAEVLAHALGPPAPLPRGAVTFLLTDIEGSTRLWEEDPQNMAAAVARHDAIAGEVVARHVGRLRKTRGEGDSTFSVFDVASDAVHAALEFQVALRAEAWPSGRGLSTRAVVHTGEAELRDGDYSGPAVNRAARVRAAGRGGQVLVTEATAALVADALGPDVGLRDLGRHRLRDIVRPERLYQLTHAALPADFAPLATLGATGNLPCRSVNFIGRVRELAEVASAMARARLVTLTGPGGCGKTSLAIEAAGNAAESYPDGVWFVDLAPLGSSDLVPGAVAEVLGLRARPGRTLTQSVAEYVGHQDALLLLDNCEHVVMGSSALVQEILAAAPQVRVLATSREHLGLPDELTWLVPPLAKPQAVTLFAERAQAALSTFGLGPDNEAAVAELCLRLDGMPLAIELAAARVSVFSVEQISSRLDDATRFLGEAGRGTVARQRTLRATLDWSYDLLSPPERALFDRLAVFSSGFTLEAVEPVGASATIPTGDVVGFFARLVDKSMVLRFEDSGQSSAPRYRLLETLRQYGLARLEAAGDAEGARSAHAANFLALAEEIDRHLYLAGSRRWFDRAAVEHDNFRTALEWAFASDRHRGSTGPRLVDALAWAWFVDGRIAEGRAWADKALAATRGERTLVRGGALRAAGLLATAQSDLGSAADLGEELLSLGVELGSAHLRASGLDLLGIARWAQGQARQAIACHQEAVAACATYGNYRDEAMGLAELSRCLVDEGDLSEARRALVLAVHKARALREETALGFTLDASASFALGMGELEDAARLVDEAIDYYRASGYQEGLASGLNVQGQVAKARGDPLSAEDAFSEALVLCRRLGHLGGAATALGGLAQVADELGEAHRSVQLCSAAATIRAQAGATLAPREQGDFIALGERLAGVLGEDCYAEVWAAGSTITLDQIGNLAVSWRNVRPPATMSRRSHLEHGK